jgi:hypothetical protein
VKSVVQFLKSFLSRKFLLAAASAGTAAAQRQYPLAAGIVAVYIAAEAHVDAKSVASQVKGLTPIVEAIEPKAAPIVEAVEKVADAVSELPAPAPAVVTIDSAEVTAAPAASPDPAP